MALLTAQQIIDFRAANQGRDPQAPSIVGLEAMTTLKRGPFDLPVAVVDRNNTPDSVVEKIRQYCVAGHSLGKFLRPWHVDPHFFDHLDPTQSWWGFEFETGWADAEARTEACTWTWDNCRGVTYDGEGEGDYPVEITFQADNRSAYEDRTADAIRFYDWLGKDGSPYEGRSSAIGTHWNVSIPETRNNSHLNRYIAYLMTNTLSNLIATNDGLSSRLFGRSHPYGWFYSQSDDKNNNHWIEGKLFRTRYTSKQFEHYRAVCARMEKVMRAVARAVIANEQLLHYVNRDRPFERISNAVVVTNLFEVMTNDDVEPVVTAIFPSTISASTK